MFMREFLVAYALNASFTSIIDKGLMTTQWNSKQLLIIKLKTIYEALGTTEFVELFHINFTFVGLIP